MPLILLNSFKILKYSHHENFDSTKSSQRFSCNVNKIFGSSVLSSNHCHKDQTNVFTLWHNRLGHPSSPVEKSIMMNCNVPNINKFSFCSTCCLGKIYTHLLERNVKLLWNSYALICGHLPQHLAPIDIDYIHFIDDYSKLT